MSESPSACVECGAPLGASSPAQLCLNCLWGGEGPGENPGDSLLKVPGHDVLGEIARGGMGVVYRARERETRRTVALKMLRPRLADEQGMRERFRLEARSVAALDHPGILPVYRVDETDDLPFFTMKLAGGGSLAERREAYRGKWRDIAALMVSLCDAVQYAHQHGVLHRDLKPHNVLFDDAGKPYLTDFGLAKLIDSVSELTGSLTFLGTPHYSAPEVAARNAAAATVASDIWSLGSMLYELLSGALPFDAEGIPALLRSIVEDQPPPLPAEVPRDLIVICLKCLAKPESGRYQSARALAGDLTAWLEGRPIAARAMSSMEKALAWIKRNPALALMGAALLLACLLAAASIVRESRASRAAQLNSENYAAAARIKEAEALLAEARARRIAGSFLDRDAAGEAAIRSWQLHRSPEARDELLSILAMPGLSAGDAPLRTLGFRGWNARTDDTFSRYVVMTKQGCSIRDLKTREEISLVPDLPVQDSTAGFAPGPLSPGGQLLALKKREGTVVWDVGRRIEILRLPPLWGSQSFSADGRWFLAGPLRTSTQNPRLCDLSISPPAVREFTEMPRGWNAHTLSPDGKFFVIGGTAEGGMRLIDASTFRAVMDYRYPGEHTLRSVLWSASSGFFLTCSHTGDISCWYPDKPDPAWILPAHAGDVYMPALFNNDTCLASAGGDGLLKFWNLITHQAAGSLPIRAVSLSASRDGMQLLADDPDRQERPLFSCSPPLTAGILRLPASLVGNAYNAGTPWIACINQQGDFAVTGGFDLHIAVQNGSRIESTHETPQNEALAVDPAGGRFFRRTGTDLTAISWRRTAPLLNPDLLSSLADRWDGMLHRFGIPLTLARPDAEPAPHYPVSRGARLAYDPAGRRLLCGGASGFQLWQMPESGLFGTPLDSGSAGLPPNAAVTALAWSPGGRFIAWSGTRPELKDSRKRQRGTWIVDTAAAAAMEVSAPFAGESIISLTFSGDESVLMAATATEVKAAATGTGAALWSHPHERPKGLPPALAAARHSTLAAVTLGKESIALIDSSRGNIRCRLTHPVTRTVRAIAFDAGGTHLAAVAGQFLQTWNLDAITESLRRQGME